LGKISETRNRKHRRAAAKPAACAKPLMLSTAGRETQTVSSSDGGTEVFIHSFIHSFIYLYQAARPIITNDNKQAVNTTSTTPHKV